MLGISESNIVDHVEGVDHTPEYDSEQAITLIYNQTDPLVISDGIDRVTVVSEGDDPYLVDYWGYRAGYLTVTREGLLELGKSLLTDRDPVPNWVLQSPADTGDLPWWVPDDYDGEPTLSCQYCGRDTSAGEIVTPGGVDGMADDRFCRECWNEVGGRWEPGHGIQDPPALDRAKDLRDHAATNPGRIDIAELGDLMRVDDPDVQRETLLALDDVVDARPDDALDLLPDVTDRLRSDDRRVRGAALSCLATLADPYPQQVTPAADKVVELLNPETDAELLEQAIQYVAAVADADPQAVLDAVPKLAALLQTGTPCEQQTVVALTRIAKAYPESVLPVTAELRSYIETEGATNRVAAFAALGYVAKEYPNVAESAIPTVIDLLDADADRLRANAAGLLADLADEYPEAVRPSVPRAIELLDDEDEKARYNATSILARVAKTHPETVEAAVDPLIDALDEEFASSRLNACWALGYLEADAAMDTLEAVNQSDPDEEVRDAAAWALHQLDESEE